MSEQMKKGDLKVPTSSALPFNARDRRSLLSDEATLDKVALASAAVAAADDSGDAELRRDALAVLRDVIVFQLKMPSNSPRRCALRLSPQTSCVCVCAVESLYQAIKKVWASKWNERAYLSRKACGVDEEELHMATLLMEVVPAEMAFVLHTANHAHGDTSEVFGGYAVGLGEALVENEPGSALGFRDEEDEGVPVHGEEPAVQAGGASYPEGRVDHREVGFQRRSRRIRGARVCTIPSLSKPPKSAR